MGGIDPEEGAHQGSSIFVDEVLSALTEEVGVRVGACHEGWQKEDEKGVKNSRRR